MLFSYRDTLEEALYQYLSDTFTLITTVKTFMDMSSEWINLRAGECDTMKGIGEKAREIQKGKFTFGEEIRF